MLFNIFTNNLTDELLKIADIYPQIFADDTNIVGQSLDLLDIIINICEKWAEKNGMMINQKKSKIMFMSNTMRIQKFE